MKCKHFSKPVSDKVNHKGLACDFECPKGADTHYNIRIRKRTITVKAESWNGWFIKLPKELSCKAGVPCTVTFNKKYLKGWLCLNPKS